MLPDIQGSVNFFFQDSRGRASARLRTGARPKLDQDVPESGNIREFRVDVEYHPPEGMLPVADNLPKVIFGARRQHAIVTPTSKK